MKNRLEYILFVFFSKIFCFVGLKRALPFARVLSGFAFNILKIRRDVVLKNLKIAFPEKDEQEIESIARSCYDGFASSLVEILAIPSMTEKDFLEYVSCDNIGQINEVRKMGKGLILMTAHFGNWEYSAIAMGLMLDHSLMVVVKGQRNTLVDDWMNRYRSRFGNRTVHLGVAIKQIFKEIENKGVVAIVGDQRGPSDGLTVKFFGRDTKVYPGPAALALKSGAPVLMGFMTRRPEGGYAFHMNPISKDGLPENREEQILVLTQRHISMLESQLKLYPDHWLWMHNIWKY